MLSNAAMADIPPMRKRFQIHLSTAVVLMVVAGLLMWANIKERKPFERGWFETIAFWKDDEPLEMFADPSKSPRPLLWTDGHGWPQVAYYLPDPLYEPWESPRRTLPTHQLNYSAATVDLAFAVFILVCSYFLCEWMVGRPHRKH